MDALESVTVVIPTDSSDPDLDPAVEELERQREWLEAVTARALEPPVQPPHRPLTITLAMAGQPQELPFNPQAAAGLLVHAYAMEGREGFNPARAAVMDTVQRALAAGDWEAARTPGAKATDASEFARWARAGVSMALIGALDADLAIASQVDRLIVDAYAMATRRYHQLAARLDREFDRYGFASLPGGNVTASQPPELAALVDTVRDLAGRLNAVAVAQADRDQADAEAAAHAAAPGGGVGDEHVELPDAGSSGGPRSFGLGRPSPQPGRAAPGDEPSGGVPDAPRDDDAEDPDARTRLSRATQALLDAIRAVHADPTGHRVAIAVAVTLASRAPAGQAVVTDTAAVETALNYLLDARERVRALRFEQTRDQGRAVAATPRRTLAQAYRDHVRVDEPESRAAGWAYARRLADGYNPLADEHLMMNLLESRREEARQAATEADELAALFRVQIAITTAAAVGDLMRAEVRDAGDQMLPWQVLGGAAAALDVAALLFPPLNLAGDALGAIVAVGTAATQLGLIAQTQRGVDARAITALLAQEDVEHARLLASRPSAWLLVQELAVDLGTLAVRNRAIEAAFGVGTLPALRLMNTIRLQEAVADLTQNAAAITEALLRDESPHG